MTIKKKTPARRKRVSTTSRDAGKFLDELIGDSLTFGNLLASIRLGEELTQLEFAKLLGITRSHVSDIENGRKVVSPARAAKFARTLGYSEAQFVQLALQSQVRDAGLKLKVNVQVMPIRAAA